MGGLREYSHARENEPLRKELVVKERKKRVQSVFGLGAGVGSRAGKGGTGLSRNRRGDRLCLKAQVGMVDKPLGGCQCSSLIFSILSTKCEARFLSKKERLGRLKRDEKVKVTTFGGWIKPY